MRYTINNEEWIPEKEARKAPYKLTEEQITLVMVYKLVRNRKRINPHNGNPFTVLSCKDLEKNLEKIKALDTKKLTRLPNGGWKIDPFLYL